MICNIRSGINIFSYTTMYKERRYYIMSEILKIDKIEKYYGNKSSLTTPKTCKCWSKMAKCTKQM